MMALVMLVESAAYSTGFCCCEKSRTRVYPCCFDIVVEDVIDLGSKRAVEFLHLALHVVLGIFSGAIELLLFVVDGFGTGRALRVTEFVALGLELLGQGLDLIIKGLELRLLGLIFALQVGEAALSLVGLRDGNLKCDDCDLGWTRGGCSSGIGSGRRLGGGSQGKA